LRINEVSSVDRGAGEGVKIMLMKQDDEEYWKREFSEEQRRSAADSGAALPDGSFPIHNKSDLHNAMRAIGRAKDPARAKAHIKRRAKALGLSGELTDAFKRFSWSEFFSDLFGKAPEFMAEENFDQALSGLAESVKSIIDDPEADKDAMLAKTFTQFHDHVSPLLGDRALQQSPDKKETPMSAILKALGLKEDASEEEALKAIAELAEKQRRRDDDEEEEDEDEDEKEERKQIENFGGKKKKPFKAKDEDEEKAMKSLPESVRKRLANGDEAMKRVQKLEDDVALVNFTKQAIAIGLPETAGTTLQKAYAGDKEAIDKLLTLTKTGFAAAKEAGAFKEFGAAGSGGGGTAFEQFTALAQAYLKAHPGEKLSESQAFTKVYEDPANKALRVQDANETGRGRTV
jgi:hypothetical protein